jgi:hypothetical protein
MADPWTPSAAAAEPKPWPAAVAAVMRSFTDYYLARMESGDLPACRRAAKVSPATGRLFEWAMDQICCPDNNEAAPASATPAETAPTAHDTP